jgi:hypothetical protein
VGECGLKSSCSVQGQVGAIVKLVSNELSGSIKDKEFLD